MYYIFCSISDNNLGPEGGRSIGEALQLNSTLTSLEYFNILISKLCYNIYILV